MVNKMFVCSCMALVWPGGSHNGPRPPSSAIMAALGTMLIPHVPQQKIINLKILIAGLFIALLQLLTNYANKLHNVLVTESCNLGQLNELLG